MKCPINKIDPEPSLCERCRYKALPECPMRELSKYDYLCAVFALTVLIGAIVVIIGCILLIAYFLTYLRGI